MFFFLGVFVMLKKFGLLLFIHSMWWWSDIHSVHLRKETDWVRKILGFRKTQLPCMNSVWNECSIRFTRHPQKKKQTSILEKSTLHILLIFHNTNIERLSNKHIPFITKYGYFNKKWFVFWNVIFGVMWNSYAYPRSNNKKDQINTEKRTTKQMKLENRMKNWAYENEYYGNGMNMMKTHSIFV